MTSRSFRSPVSPSATAARRTATASRSGDSAEGLGERDDDPRGSPEIAEQVIVLVASDLADEFASLGAQPRDGVLDVVDLEHDRAQAEGVRGRIGGLAPRRER